MSDQPMPTQGKVSVTEPFRKRFVEEGAERDMVGLECYGTALRTHNGRDAGRDAWDEWYDLGKYLEQLRLEHADALEAISELVEALANLHSAVVTVTNADPTHYEVANVVGLPALVAHQLVERYRPKGATP